MSTGRIRIVHCIGSLGVGGAEHQLTELIRRLPPDRFEQSLVLFKREGAFLERIEHTDCTVIGLWPQRTKAPIRFQGSADGPRALTRFVRFLRRTRPHVVHAQLAMANIVAFGAGRLARVPVIATSQLNLCRDPGEETRIQRIENRVLRRSGGVFANSRAVVDDLVQLQQVSSERIRLIYNGVDVDRFVPQSAASQSTSRARAGFAADDRVIACVANLHPYKGHDDLISAFARLDPMDHDLQLMLVGRDAGAEPGARQLVAELGLTDVVRFMGQVTDVADLISFAELVVHPSHEEGFANAIIEAMSSGKAVVATDVGGNGEAIVHDRTGLLVPARNPAALATAIDALLADGARTNLMGQAARRRAEEEFGFDRMIGDFESWYTDLVAGSRRQVRPADRP